MRRAFVPSDRQLAATAIADSRPGELYAPVAATLNQVSSRDRYARANAAAAFAKLSTADGQAVSITGNPDYTSAWFRVALYGQPGPEPPLGWTLAPQTVRDMRSQLQAPPNAKAIEYLRNALDANNLACPKT